ncbi:chemotaxis protein CheD [Bacillus mangrovi]|uniref:Probable chemoreceptor glutamine deamidase CheD n=1 Tax=Metabacillus mangrovi TaxID=1491830 RepID=A0A7X2V3K1_9BACI|nr:chemotaxis protein CheD [Metabacillus mangrovi]MTH52767.1 chemotaxis protein CheD [Metabacillus mangrovi]
MKTDEQRIIKIGIADMSTAAPPAKLRTSGLGSCIGLVLYDPMLKNAGMAHIMLPTSSLARSEGFNRNKYADTAIADLLVHLKRMGSPAGRLKAKMAGGAQMFAFKAQNEMMRIGPRNTEAVKELLAHYAIQLVSSDTGGGSGRTIEFDPETLLLTIRTVNTGTSII